MTKSEAVRITKNANSRLKPIGDVCLRLVQGRATRSPEREQALMVARLNRELTPEDKAGPALVKAVDDFCHANQAGVRGEKLYQLALAVQHLVRTVQSDRWIRFEATYGDVRQHFLAYGMTLPLHHQEAPTMFERWLDAIRGMKRRVGFLLRREW
jgi:hypothetical protein